MSSRTVLVGGLLAAAAGGGLWLRPILDQWTRPPVAGTESAARYQCPMDPQIRSDQPGTCPICQMRLNRVDDEPMAVLPGQAVVGYRHPMRPDVTSPTPAVDEMGMAYLPIYAEEVGATVTVPGHAPFTLSAERQQLIGVTRGVVERRPLSLTIRAVGRVAYDPMLYQAIVEYREALRARADIHKSPWAEAHEGASAIVRAAALKLRQQGISEAMLAGIARDGGDPVNLLLPGKSVWVYAQIYESEIALVHTGQPITLTSPAHPGRRWTAEVAGVDAILDAVTRTARVRALVATPDAELQPEMFVDALIEVPLGEQLAVPEGAVLDTGVQRLVFVVSGEGRFEPRAVELGRTAQGFTEVRSGLVAGETVVTSANFLIDSESRFRAALAAFGGGQAR